MWHVVVSFIMVSEWEQVMWWRVRICHDGSGGSVGWILMWWWSKRVFVWSSASVGVGRSGWELLYCSIIVLQ